MTLSKTPTPLIRMQPASKAAPPRMQAKAATHSVKTAGQSTVRIQGHVTKTINQTVRLPTPVRVQQQSSRITQPQQMQPVRLTLQSPQVTRGAATIHQPQTPGQAARLSLQGVQQVQPTRLNVQNTQPTQVIRLQTPLSSSSLTNSPSGALSVNVTAG